MENRLKNGGELGPPVNAVFSGEAQKSAVFGHYQGKTDPIRVNGLAHRVKTGAGQ